MDLLDPKTIKSDVILLGEGDFSFTRSLELYFGSSSKPRLISTSFDSGEEVVKKYRDANVWLAKWRQGGSAVQALHGVDATKDILAQLGPAAADCKCNTVIFNFPHLGVEDAKLHGAMVAHVMMRARELLLGSGGAGKGFFILALADAQAERWKVNDMAIRNNMPLFRQFAFRPTDWPGYKIRRHINGKSFERKVQSCSFFCYAVEEDSSEKNPILRLLEGILHDEEGVYLQQVAKTRSKEDFTFGKTALAVQDDNKEEEEEKKKKEKKKKKAGEKILKGKRKIQAMAQGYWHSRLPTVEEVELGAAWAEHKIYLCLLCQADEVAKLYKSEESVADHVYTHHLREDLKCSKGEATNEKSGSNVWGGKEEEAESACLLQCPLCAKHTKNRAGLDYHMQAVHGDYRVLKPSWAASAKLGHGSGDNKKNHDELELDNEALRGPRYECEVCGMCFSNESELFAHREGGFQPTVEKACTLQCTLCDKQLKDERALYQHMNMCRGRKK